MSEIAKVCGCDTCARHRAMREKLSLLDPAERLFWATVVSDLMNAEDDRDYYRMKYEELKRESENRITPDGASIVSDGGVQETPRPDKLIPDDGKFLYAGPGFPTGESRLGEDIKRLMESTEIDWMIVYDDTDVKPEHFHCTRAEIEKIVASRELNWSCHLFVNVDKA